MLETIRQVFEGVAGRLHHQVTTLLPPLLAGAVVMLLAWIFAVLSRWTIVKIFKGLTLDRFLKQSGIAFAIAPSGRLRAARVAAETGYWLFLIAGALTALGIFNTELTTRMVQDVILLLPKLVVAGGILLAGVWLAQYFGRIVLIWAVKEKLPSPMTISAIVRILTVFVAIVVAADQLNFARSVFLAAFIMVGGGVTLALSLAVGLGAAPSLRRVLRDKRILARRDLGHQP